MAAGAAVDTAFGQSPTFSTVASDAYGAGGVNSVSVGINNLTTFGQHQFIAYYNTSGNVMVGRRTLGASTWQTFNSGLSATAAQMSDDHNVIGIAIDGAGRMHTSWNMHNQSLRYAISNASVTTASLGGISFTMQTAANAPTLFPSAGTTTNSVTYPQFYSIPDSDDLLFTYRNGGAGGGSGNGNQYFNVYDPGTNTWTNRTVIDGQSTSVNGYINSMARTSTGALMMSWTFRSSPSWQTNSNIMFARTPDNGATWTRKDGTPYTLPIKQNGSPASSVAEVIKAIPQNNSLINQTSMTVDNGDNPLIATWYAPQAGVGNHDRQYMLVYHTGNEWRTSQITNRTSDNAIDTSAFAVRDLGRPIVLVDDADRVLVVTRSTDTSMGAYSNPATADNEIVVYHNTVASLNSATPAPWQSITLDDVNMGAWEPTYDAALWARDKKLSLFYEPVGLSGQTVGTLKVLDWDPAADFASLNSWNRSTGGNWDTPGNWTAGVPNAVGARANFGGGVAPSADATITINGTKTIGSISFGSPVHSYSLVSGTNGALALGNGVGVAATLSATSGSHTIAVPVDIADDGVNVGVSDGARLTISGPLGGAGPLRKNSGGGTLVLSGTNTHGGQTTLTAGTLRVTAAAALSPNSNLAIAGGVLESGVSLSRGRGTGAGQIQITGGVSGFGASGGHATFTLTGTTPTWGTSTFNPSVLVLNTPASTHNVTIASNISLNNGARSVLVNAGVNTFSGVISGGGGGGTGSLLVNGPGTLVLSGANTYNGGTFINAGAQGPGAVRAAHNQALGGGVVDIGQQGNLTTAALELSNNITVPNAITFRGRTNNSAGLRNVGGNNTLAGNVTLQTGGNVYWVESEAGTLTIAGTVSSLATGGRFLTLRGAGNGALTGTVQNGSAAPLAVSKDGGGTWTISGNPTYTGATSVQNGLLRLQTNLIRSSGVTVSGGVLQLASDGTGGRTIVAPSVAVTGGQLDLADNRLITKSDIGDVSFRPDGTGVYNGIQGRIQAARTAEGTWDQPGITTSMPEASQTGLETLGVAVAGEVLSFDGATTLWGGQTVSMTDTIVMYTHTGDANLDGAVDGGDYAFIDVSVGSDQASYHKGDFNYDGFIDGGDYAYIDVNVGASGAAGRNDGSGASLAAVPEPAGACVVALAAVALASRRRRRG